MESARPGDERRSERSPSAWPTTSRCRTRPSSRCGSSVSLPAITPVGSQVNPYPLHLITHTSLAAMASARRPIATTNTHVVDTDCRIPPAFPEAHLVSRLSADRSGKPAFALGRAPSGRRGLVVQVRGRRVSEVNLADRAPSAGRWYARSARWGSGPQTEVRPRIRILRCPGPGDLLSVQRINPGRPCRRRPVRERGETLCWRGARLGRRCGSDLQSSFRGYAPEAWCVAACP
jgi:hypothetical protein